MIGAACVQTADTDFLAVSSEAPRLAEGFRRIDAALPGWGLQLIDVNVALGSLLRLAGAQAAVYAAANPR